MDAAYLALAAKYVRRQAKQLAEQLDGVRAASDIEYVHRARVASRRLRAALRVFADCFGAKPAKRWRKQIRNVTRELGAARDSDVQLDFLFGFLHGLKVPAVYPGVVRLLSRLERQREELQPQVIAAVERLRAKGAIDDLLFATRRIWSKLNPGADRQRSAHACRLAEKHVVGRLEEMLPLQDSLHDAEATPRHHALRIAVKRLRYTLEIVKPLYGEPLETVIAAARTMQTLLGDMHDCDVWEQRLDALTAAERKRIRKHFGHEGPLARLEVGIEYLRQDRRARRQEAFEELSAFWGEATQQGRWDDLRRILRGEAIEPQTPPAPAQQPAASATTSVPAPATIAAPVPRPKYLAPGFPEDYVQSPRALSAAFREPAVSSAREAVRS
jgi:CHAD domain-containing protein